VWLQRQRRGRIFLIWRRGVPVPIFRRPDVHADQPAHFIVGRAEVCWRFETRSIKASFTVSRHAKPPITIAWVEGSGTLVGIGLLTQ
jgi:hypothetical protein